MPLLSRWLTSHVGVAGVLAVAAIGRLAVVTGAGDVAPVADMAEYWDRALHLVRTGTLYPDSWRMPGLPVWLSAAFSIAGTPSLQTARLANVVAGVGAVGLTYEFARRAGDRQRALIAAAIVAVYPTLLLYSAMVATEAVVAVPMLLALVLGGRSTLPGALGTGAAMGVAMLVRPASIALLPAALGTAMLTPADGPTRSRLSRLVAVIAGSMLVLAPWWAHNAALHHRFIPLDTTGGLNLAIGSGPGATGRWYFSHVVRLQSGELAGVDVTTPAGADRAIAVAAEQVQASPLRWLRLVPAKLAALFSVEGRETAYLYSIGYFGERSPMTVALWAIAVMVAFPLLLTAAAGGLARDAVPASVRVPLLLTIAATAAMHLLAFGDPRFHLPLVPLLAVAAPYASLRHRSAIGASLATCALLAPAWYAQAAHYMPFLRLLMLPGGSSSPLSFDALF